jgi:hypothetical protein
METVFSIWYVRNAVNRVSLVPEEIAGKQFCTGIGEGRTCAREAEESPLLEAVAMERLLKKKAGAVICRD